MTYILAAEGLWKSFGAATAAAGISLAFHAGQTVSLIGANGAGKTTFVNMTTGYLRPDRGRILFSGHDIVGLTPRQITRLGICRSFQIPQLFNSLTASENLLIAAEIAGMAQPANIASAALARFGLNAYASQRAGLLPEGIRKLLDVAMAMAGKPALLLLDEPTSGVAAGEKFGIMDMVMSAAANSGATIVFVEHDMEIVARYAARVIAFYEGRIIGDGPPAAVLQADEVRRYVIGEETRHAAA
jgi:branched-chain amino acid transport system ATP-binding protein